MTAWRQPCPQQLHLWEATVAAEGRVVSSWCSYSQSGTDNDHNSGQMSPPSNESEPELIKVHK